MPKHLTSQMRVPDTGQLEWALHKQGANFRLIHPLLISRYAPASDHHRDTAFDVVGLDIETNHKTGEPRLLGLAYPDNRYFAYENPTLADLYRIVDRIIDTAVGTNIATWGSLDIQCLIRMFEPTAHERYQISRGISGRFKKGKWIADPPLKREMPDGNLFYIDHYISGRSLRLGVVYGGTLQYSIWIYNLSQFYPGTIEETALGLQYDWESFGKDTHLIDWDVYYNDVLFEWAFEDDGEVSYRDRCVASNRQDAITVRKLCFYIQDVFSRVFGAYPSLLVSAGSLADGAVSKMLKKSDYESNSWRWLSQHAIKNKADVRPAETLFAEAFSAGYVDQMALGYFDSAWTADIAAAYPHKMRALPDLRYADIEMGTGDIQRRLRQLKGQRKRIVTAVFRGVVTIPKSLKYHPITVKTATRQNIRPVGATFGAAYYLEEREFVKQHGGSFADEEWCIVYLNRYKKSPIAEVSEKLGMLRTKYLNERDAEVEKSPEWLVLDGMQYVVKVVDNSLYGKTVMTTPVVENDATGNPIITGFRAGDRFNMLIGGMITSRTRIQIADACMSIEANGGRVLLTMTDSVYWLGKSEDMPERMVRHQKTPGYYETPEQVDEFFLLKTGQYEYKKGGEYHHKMRGLNVPFELRTAGDSFYRQFIKNGTKGLDTHTHPDDIRLPISTRKLVTIGAFDMSKLGLVEDSIALMKPFVLSGKQSERYVFSWHRCIDGHMFLRPSTIRNNTNTPLKLLRELYIEGGDYLDRYERKALYAYECILRVAADEMPENVGALIKSVGKYLPDRITNMTWEQLVNWFQIPPEDIFTAQIPMPTSLIGASDTSGDSG